MKRFPIALLALCLCTGCGQSGNGTTMPTTSGATTVVNNNKPLIVAAITTASQIGTNQGLRALAKTNPVAAGETATALKRAIEVDLLPYLNGGKLGTSAEVQALLNSSLFSGKVNPAVRDAIAAAAAILDAYLPVPGANTFLSADHIDYIRAFLTGIDKGCKDFEAKALSPNPRWVELAN